MNQNKILCLFHRDCLDGFASAYVVWKQFGADNVEFMAVGYEDPIPDLTDRTVYIVDFSYKPEVLIPAAYAAKTIYMLDHHKSAIEEWANISHGNVKKIFDMNRSGVGVVYQHFYPDSQLPFILACIQDYDLWRFEIPSSRCIVTALYSYDFIADLDFNTFDDYVRGGNKVEDNMSPFGSHLYEQGSTILQYQNSLANSIIRRSSGMTLIQGCSVPIVEMPRELHSLAGQIMSERYPFSVTYEDNLKTNTRTYSFRSNQLNPAAVDVSEICRLFGGGGHKHAAGFTLKINEFNIYTNPRSIFMQPLQSNPSDSAINYVL